MITAIIISFICIALLAHTVWVQKKGFKLLFRKIDSLIGDIEDAREDIYELQDEAKEDEAEISIWRTKDSHKNK